MHHCLGFVHRCMHYNAGEYNKFTGQNVLVIIIISNPFLFMEVVINYKDNNF